jgi:phosphoglucosamine mutase
MSNLGLEKAFERMGVRMLRASVGDKYVLEAMLRSGAVLGGEQSGHIILREYATTGDGMLTGVKVLETMVAGKGDLDELISDLEVYPQLTLNVGVVRKKALEEMDRVRAAIADAERAFQGRGRVLVRFSGTEPLCRVMVEGREAEMVRVWADRIASSVSAEIG